MNHRSIPSLSSSISSHDSPASTTASTPRTSSSSSMYRMYGNKLTHSNSLKIPSSTPPPIAIEQKRYSEPPPVTTTKRWDDSQLEMVLAEDDFLQQSKVRRNSSLRLKEKLQLSESFIKDKLRNHRNNKTSKKSLRKRIYDWLF